MVRSQNWPDFSSPKAELRDISFVATDAFYQLLKVSYLSLNPAPPGLFPYPRPPGEGGGGSDPNSHGISRTNGRIEPREAVFESFLRDLSKPHLKFCDCVINGYGFWAICLPKRDISTWNLACQMSRHGSATHGTLFSKILNILDFGKVRYNLRFFSNLLGKKSFS